jgi:hypothetical protein
MGGLIYRMLGILSAAVDQALNDGYQGRWATGDMSWEFGPERDFSKLVEKHPTLVGSKTEKTELAN